MPIRFRCQYCNQLLGIARRKAGQGVECPTCHGQLTVPLADGAAVGASAGQPPPPLFERSDFDAYLNGGAAENPPIIVPQRPGPAAPAAAPPAAFPAFDVERLEPASAPRAAEPATTGAPAGLVLSPAQATVLTVVAILILAMAFGTGLLVGRYFL
jgi:hypothetical protein